VTDYITVEPQRDEDRIQKALVSMTCRTLLWSQNLCCKDPELACILINKKTKKMWSVEFLCLCTRIG